MVFTVCTIWELLFSVVRGHEVNEGMFVSTILFALIVPPTLPLWQAALGITFGIIVAKEIFGGVGRNFMNPCTCWSCVLILRLSSSNFRRYGLDCRRWFLWCNRTFTVVYKGGQGALQHTVTGAPITWMDAFVGNLPGSMGKFLPLQF